MIDLAGVKKIYFIGIKGVAMSGLAVICQQRGLMVTGSDVAEKFITDKTLSSQRIRIFQGFDPSNLAIRPDLVVIGTSWGEDNVEVKYCLESGIPMITDSELRGLLSREKRTVAVTGVHGKTTTTAIIAYLLDRAGLKPSYLIGTGTVGDLGGNAAWRAGAHFVVEGDEYAKSRTDKAPKFLDLQPAITIITSLEWEHVDVFRDLEIMEKYFQALVEKTKDSVIACGDWPSVKKIIAQSKNAVTYGLQPDNDWQAYDIATAPEKTVFKVINGDNDLGEFQIKLFGDHNVLNSLAAIIVGLREGIELEKIRQILRDFSGTQRRFEVKVSNNIIFVDDYAHHPTEIKTTLKAIKSRYPDKYLYCVFQPHTVSRTKALLDQFAACFEPADEVLLADIFASAREPLSEFTSKDLAAAVSKQHKNVKYLATFAAVVDYLKPKINPDCVVITMGAGNVYEVRDKLINNK